MSLQSALPHSADLAGLAGLAGLANQVGRPDRRDRADGYVQRQGERQVERPTRGWSRVRPDAQAGVSTVELLVWFPGLILIVALVLQVFTYVWARESAQGAARYGAYHARLYQGTDADGIAQARAYLNEVAGTLVEKPAVRVARTGTGVDVTITAQAMHLPLPLLHMPAFTVHAGGPIEQFASRP